MEKTPLIKIIEDYKLCVVIPTYNNAKTLASVIKGVLQYVPNVIVVNDGSTDETATVLRSIEEKIKVLSFSKNNGKGFALKKGFEKAQELGFYHAITIDSDGQHFPEDLPVFIETLAKEYSKEIPLLLIGARNMKQDGIPKKSSFGNKFSNFWFWVETGNRLTDTQSGYRLYPVHFINALNLKTKKFEFEIEAIVKTAWRGGLVKNIPVQIHYEQENRVSHFRPFKDFIRISLLNTWLVIVALFYIKPRYFYRVLKKKGIKRFFAEDVLGSYDSPQKKAYSIALGVLVGLSPLWGFHTLIVLFLAVVLKLNKAIAFAFSNVSLPPFIPFVIFAGLQTGVLVTGVNNTFKIGDISSGFDLGEFLKVYLIGSFVFSIVTATVVGILSYMMLISFQYHKRKV